MDKTKTRLAKFSISIRQETMQALDKAAFDDNRSRSALIDKICIEYFESLKNGERWYNPSAVKLLSDFERKKQLQFKKDCDEGKV